MNSNSISQNRGLSKIGILKIVVFLMAFLFDCWMSYLRFKERPKKRQPRAQTDLKPRRATKRASLDHLDVSNVEVLEAPLQKPRKRTRSASTKPPTPKQLAARQRFAEMARTGELAALRRARRQGERGVNREIQVIEVSRLIAESNDGK